MKLRAMFSNYQVLSVLLALLCVLPATASAASPDSVNYQGVLTDAGGNPVADGNYNVTLSIYDVPVGGVALWSETKAVATVDGLFNTLLGSVNPLPTSVFDGPDRFLGTAVSPDPEMTPRTAIVTVPYSHRVSTVDGATGGAISGDVDITTSSIGNALSVTQSGGGRGGFFQIANGANTEAAVQGTHVGPGAGGSFFSDGGGPGIRASATGGTAAELEGRVNAYGDITGYDGVDPAFEVDVTASQISTFGSDGLEQIRLWGVGFGELLLNDNTGNNQTAKLSATTNSGGQLTLNDETGVTEIFLNGGGSGDASVQLPSDAISAVEILDEAGVANRIQSVSVELSGSTDFDILIRTITVPTSGYVVAMASGMISMSHVNDGLTSANFGIVPPGGTLLSSPKVWATVPSSTPTGTHVIPISITVAFSVTAGSHQYALQAEEASTGSGIPTVLGSQLTLLFVPTAYGTFTSNVANGSSEPLESREAESGASKSFNSQRMASELQELRAKLDALQTQVDQNEN